MAFEHLVSVVPISMDMTSRVNLEEFEQMLHGWDK
jgi:hypothetical protein